MATQGIKNWPLSTTLLLISASSRENPIANIRINLTLPETVLPGEHFVTDKF